MKPLLVTLVALLVSACGLEALPVRTGDAGATSADAGAPATEDADGAEPDAGDVQHGVWTGAGNVCGLCDDAGCVDVPCDAGGD